MGYNSKLLSSNHKAENSSKLVVVVNNIMGKHLTAWYLQICIPSSTNTASDSDFSCVGLSKNQKQ
jgi:hypothetical protein